MLNPEKECLTVERTAKSIDLQIKTPKLFKPSALKTIVGYQMPLEDREIIAIEDGKEIVLLNNRVRRMLSFGAPEEKLIENIASHARVADQIIIRDILNTPGSTFEEIAKNNPEFPWLNK